MSILLYGCTTWTLTKRIEKKTKWELHKNAWSYFEQILEATPHETAAVLLLTSHLKNIKIWRTTHAGDCWRSKDELISDVLLRTPAHGRASSIRKLDIVWMTCRKRWVIGTNRERERERERVREIRINGVTWWLWWWFILKWTIHF